MVGGFLAVFGSIAHAGAATDSFALSSAAVSGQSSVTWQGPPVNPPGTPNVFPDQSNPITLTGQIDPASGAISGATLSLPALPQPPESGAIPVFTFSEVHPGSATGNFNSSTDAVTLQDSLTLTFTTTGIIDITCVSTPINVAFSGTWGSTTQNVTLAASGFTIPNFVPGNSNCSLAAGSLNASPGGTAGAIGNAFAIALHGQFAPGLPTTTTLAASPNSPQLAGTAVTLTATVTDPSSQGTPTGAVTFLDNGASIGTGTLSGSGSSPTATLTTSTLPAGAKQQLTATYPGDTTYSASISAATAYTITPLPTVGANLPASMTVPSTSQQPTVSGLSPAAGPASGGTQVTITGSGFTSKSTVDFGSHAATSVTVNNSTQITATSPAGTDTVDVTVNNGSGTSATSVADLFAYGAPTVTGVSPNIGPAGVGFANVMITGTHFVPGATVNFGSTASGLVTVTSATLITATAPSASAGTVDVTVTTPAGTSATSGADQYTYSSAPAVSRLATPAGPAAGGTSVAITGSNFTGATAVNFGSTPAASFTVSSATAITAVSPAGTSGTAVDITVTTPNGTSAKWLYDQFTYGPPTVTGVSPSGGPAAGGTSVTITGTGFAPSAIAKDGPSVKFGTKSISATGVTVNSPTSLTVTAPAGTGTVNVTVTTKSGGTSATSPADQFTYGPTVTGVSPPSGPTAGGTAVSIAGTSFTGATAVSFGTAAATSFSVNSTTSITAVAPAGTTGTVDLTVTTPIATSATSTADQFTYGPPSVTAVASNAGPTAGGTQVTISGTGFSGATAVAFGTTPATSYSVVSPIQITAVAPAGTGTVHIKVTTNGGSSSAGGTANEFTYSDAPSIASLAPATGSQGTGVTITGANFTAANGVYFGSTPASAFTVVNDGTVTATAPSGSGAVDVTVSSSNGTSATGPGDVFAYGLPTVTNVAPSAGPTAGGTSVVITGTGFVGGSTVDFGSVAATSVTITSPTSITAVSPEEGAGAVDVTVTNAAGTSNTSTADVFTYSAGGAPGQASLIITNPPSGQSWNNVYVQVVVAGIYDKQSNLQPSSDFTLSYQDASGGWCPLTASTSGSNYIFSLSGVGSSCGDVPSSMSLGAGSSITIPIQLSYNSGTFLGAQVVTATLYSGTCSGPTSCTQSGALNGNVVGSGTVQLNPPARLATTVGDYASTGDAPPASSPVHQGFQVTLLDCVTAAVQSTGTPQPTGTLEYLVDGSPIAITSDGSTPAANPNPLSFGCTTGNAEGEAFFDTSALSLGTHTLTVLYSGDSVFAPSTLTETFTVLPTPTGTPYTCNFNLAGLAELNGTGYVTTTSSTPAPTPSGSNAWVSDAAVSVDLDPAVLSLAGGELPTGVTTNFTLSPSGSMSTSNLTQAADATDSVLTWSGMSASVPVAGDPGSTVAIGVGSLSYVEPSSFGNVTFTCAPVSGNAPLASVPIAGNTLSASPSGSAAPGAPVTLTDTVSPTPPADGSQAGQYGQVTFYDGSNVLGTVPVDATGDAGNGTAVLTTDQLALGDHQLTAQWSGTANVAANTSAVVDYQVGASSTTTLASSANPANALNPVTFTATVNGEQGSPSPTGNVAFSEDGNPITGCASQPLSTANPPTATCKLSLPAGQTHAIVATYSGDGTYIGSASDPVSQVTLPGTKTTILSTKDPSPPGNVTFWAGVSPASGSGATPTGTVAFAIDGSTYKACASQPLGAGGGASCTVSFKAGTTHKVFATYAGSASYSGSKSATVTQTVTGSKSSTTPKDTGGSATLNSGKALTAGQSLTVGSYKLVMQGDGNLVEYQGTKALWASGTAGHPGAGVTMQKDGNLVIYSQGKAVWASKTAGHAGAHLTLQGSDGNVVIYQGSTALWATGT